MKFIFIFLSVVYLLLFLIRWLLSLIYYKKGQSHIADFPEELLQWSNLSSLGILV